MKPSAHESELRQELARRIGSSASALRAQARQLSDAVQFDTSPDPLTALTGIRAQLGRLADDIAHYVAVFGEGDLAERTARIGAALGIGPRAAATRYGHGPPAMPLLLMSYGQLDDEE